MSSAAYTVFTVSSSMGQTQRRIKTQQHAEPRDIIIEHIRTFTEHDDDTAYDVKIDKYEMRRNGTIYYDSTPIGSISLKDFRNKDLNLFKAE